MYPFTRLVNQSMQFKNPDSLAEAILQTISYVDIFDYPITLPEIHRYLIGQDASLSEVREELHNGQMTTEKIGSDGEFYFLAGRQDLVQLRHNRSTNSVPLWSQGMRYGRWISQIPFVRMVAITGALASRNVVHDADLDYLIVTEPGYLWLTRAMILALNRMVAPFGATICPNYLLSLNVLSLTEKDLFIAQELARMVPISGWQIYQQMRELNTWTDTYLPNAQDAPTEIYLTETKLKLLQWLGEFLLRNPLGKRLEAWEMKRKITKLSQQIDDNSIEIHFSADSCKGHFEQHGRSTLKRFSEIVSQIKEI